MRIAVIADIHGNLPALEAVLEALDTLQPDQIVVSGDVVDGGPDSAACWERVKQIGCPVLRGNHERYVFDYGTERADPLWATPQFGPLQYTRNSMSDEQIKEIAALPTSWQSPAAPGLLIVHASARRDSDSVLPYTPIEYLDEMFAGVDDSLIIRSHNHICSTRDWRGKRIVTTGAVGLSLDGCPQAKFCVLTQDIQGHWRVDHRAIKYDVDAAVRRFTESGYLDATGPLGRLFVREVATGSNHVVPFLRYLGPHRQGASLEIVEASLNEFYAGMMI